LEETERELGNAEFKAGNFSAAVKCYTKCLGLKYQNYVAFSNRAMAYIKLKEYVRAVIDCDCALNIEPMHVKSLLRRATALNALGKHRAALLDLLAAQDVEPSNKQVRSDSTNTRELLRAAVNRAPHTPMRSYDELLAVHRQHRQARGNHQDSATESTNGDVVDTKAVQEVYEEQEQEEDEGILQGPDPLPASFATPPPPPSAASATTSHAHDTQRDDKEEEKNNNKEEEYVTGVRIPISLASDDDDDDKEKKREGEQGASRRGKATSSVGTTEADSRMHRVAISAESDDGSSSSDDDDADIPPPTAASSSSSSPHPPGSAQRPAVVGKSTTHVKIKTTSNTPTTKKKATSSGGKSTKSGGSPTKSSSSSSLSSSQRFSSSSSFSSGGGVLGAYELEKALVQAQGHVSALHRLLASLQPAHDASRIFQSVVEPEAMVLLLESLWHVIVSPPPEGDAPLTTDHFWQWCYALQALPSFPLLYSLVSREGAQSLQEHLRSLQQSSPWKGHSKKMHVVLGKFC
jgi:hypothetical protein